MNITRENIAKELSLKYPNLNFTLTTIRKNGDVMKDAICVQNGSRISPTIYTDDIIAHSASLDNAVEIISNIIDKESLPDVDIKKFTDKDFILNHVRIGIQKESSEELIKKDVPEFDGIEQYLFITEKSLNHSFNLWSVKLRPDHLDSVGISMEELWQNAEINTFASTTIQSMSEILNEMVGDEYEKDMNIVTPSEMFVISNTEKYKGASSILNREALKRFADEHCSEKSSQKSIAILPSSIHECILIPMSDAIDLNELNNMVSNINSTLVAPEDVLIDRVYLINF